MDTEEMFTNLSFLNLLKMYKKLKGKRRHRLRRWGVRPINWDYITAGYNKKVFMKIKQLDEEEFFRHTRMCPDLFNLLLALIGDELRIGPEERLAITLLYLGHGCSLQSIAWSHKLGKTTVRNIVLETCELLWHLLSPMYVSEPSTNQYQDIANDFKRMWDIPNCVGAIDGKHIAIKCPKNSGSLYHNYKKYFSTVLMGVCDANYTFISVNVGSYGSQSDGGIFRLSQFGKSIITGPFLFPHFFIGDAAFPLQNSLMRPYPGANIDTKKRIFNYRLSRARRVIENCFGILSARWRILLTTNDMSPENADKIVLGCVVLHNFIMLNDHKRWYCPRSFIDNEREDGIIQEGGWRNELRTSGITPLRSFSTHIRRSTQTSINLRDRLADYFSNEGALPFQERMI